MLIEQIFEFKLRGPGRTLICTTTGYFYDQEKISKENFRVNYYLLLK